MRLHAGRPVGVCGLLVTSPASSFSRHALRSLWQWTLPDCGGACLWNLTCRCSSMRTCWERGVFQDVPELGSSYLQGPAVLPQAGACPELGLPLTAEPGNNLRGHLPILFHATLTALQTPNPKPPCRGLLSRPELALCLTAEVAYEHDEDFRGHLPLLFHATLTAMDAPEPLVYQHAQQLLVNLLYSLSARHLELHKAAGGRPRLA